MGIGSIFKAIAPAIGAAVPGAGTALSIAGGIAGLAGDVKGNKTTYAPVRTMDQSLTEMDKLRQYLAENTSYNARPTRRLTAAELEGPFAPVAVREIQNYFDSQYPGQSVYGGAQEPDKATAAQDVSAFSPADEVFIKQYESGLLPQNQYAMQYKDALKRREQAGKVPMPMGGYMPAPAGAAQAPKPLSSSELDALRAILAKGAA